MRSARTQTPSFILAAACLSAQPGSSPTATSVQVGVCSHRCDLSQRKEMFENGVCGCVSSEPDLKACAPRRL